MGPRAPVQRRRKLAGRSALAVLLVLAVVTGSLAGLTLVYSVDLPQIDELEHYRPSTLTDLYDRKGRVIGSFALERREVVDYDGFAPVLRQAVISIEDKSFESHWGVNVLRIGGAVVARPAHPRPLAGRLDAHHAVGAQPLSLRRPSLRPQAPGSLPRHPD